MGIMKDFRVMIWFYSIIFIIGVFCMCGIEHEIRAGNYCPNGVWAPINYCTNICPGHNHSMMISYNDNTYTCHCDDGTNITTKAVCI
jgi:hypothetical protein